MSFSNVIHPRESLYLGPLVSYRIDETGALTGYLVKFADGRCEEFSPDEGDKVKAIFAAYEEQRAKEI